ncbi:MAG: tetraacyldisaccharide 4'-kinase [Flavobacterium sp.]|nr:MAG: tetraacyldisaccharide 4'-kinase [Flavobacterium sp.]
MVWLRKLLFPFSILYGLVTRLRNFLYDAEILKSTTFPVPIIAVGNLSVGGTGKSPMVEYLLRILLPQFRVATLSRGYKRASSGFILADENSDARSLGDEPFQFYKKFPQAIVAVDADRCNGISKLLAQKTAPEIIVLDDAFQHRKVRAGFYILLTSYDDPYFSDLFLPAGNLRESRSGARRADVIVVTKCPPTLSNQEQLNIRKKLESLPRQQVYFTSIGYNDVVEGIGNIPVVAIKKEPKLLVAGIAKPEPFFAYLQSGSDEVMRFPDHHDFSDSDINNIRRKAAGRKIVTTEKDYVRLNGRIENNLYYLPIRCEFLEDATDFNKTIKEYVGKSTGNSQLHQGNH